jgi:hypothetical protein
VIVGGDLRVRFLCCSRAASVMICFQRVHIPNQREQRIVS